MIIVMGIHSIAYLLIVKPSTSFSQDKEIYRWPIKESVKAMLAWEWTIEKARDGEGEVEKKAAATTATRKISQTAQVKVHIGMQGFYISVRTEHSWIMQNEFSLGLIKLGKQWSFSFTEKLHMDTVTHKIFF